MAGVVPYEVDGHVAVLTLNRPEALNAVNSALADAVGGYLEEARWIRECG
jgi:enoyl-CoA hydratase/carnithine racemase